MALINTTTTGVLGSTFYADGSGDLTIQQNGVTINQISSTGLLNGRLTSMTSQASTSGTSIDFTGIPSWVKRITVMFSGVSTNGSSAVLVQLGDSGGIENTGYLGSGNATNFTTGFSDGFADGAAVRHGQFNICLADSSTNKWVCAVSMGKSDTTTSSVGGFSKPLSATLDRVRITTVNGTDTFDAGTINVLYE